MSMSIAEFRQLSKPKRSKYGNRKTEVDGILFDSAKEAKRFRELRLLSAAGEITELDLQVTIWLMAGDQPIRYDSGRRATYVADFVYRNRNGDIVREDTKGFRTPAYKLKRAILRTMGIEIIEV